MGDVTRDPQWLAASTAANDLRKRIKGREASRDERRLFTRYAEQMEAADDRVRAAEWAELGLPEID